jgi:hypothetical protein
MPHVVFRSAPTWLGDIARKVDASLIKIVVVPILPSGVVFVSFSEFQVPIAESLMGLIVVLPIAAQAALIQQVVPIGG